MKQGMTANLPVMFDIPLNTVEMIEFVFKQYVSYRAPVLKYSVYKADGTGDAFPGEDGLNQINVPWAAEETYRFIPGRQFYMDTRITSSGGLNGIQVPIMPLRMDQSLFTVPADIQPGAPGWSDMMYDDSELRGLIADMADSLTGIQDSLSVLSERTDALSTYHDSPYIEKLEDGVMIPPDGAAPCRIKVIYGKSVQNASGISNIEALHINYIGKNLFIRQVEYAGKQLTSDGLMVDNSRYVATARLPIISNREHLYISSDIWTPAGIRVCFYDADDAFIKLNIVNFYSEVNIPEEARYVRFSYIADEYSNTATMVEYGTDESVYEPGMFHSFTYIPVRPLNGDADIKDALTSTGYTFNFKCPLDNGVPLDDQALDVPEEVPVGDDVKSMLAGVRGMSELHTFFITDQSGNPVEYKVEYMKNNTYVRDVQAYGMSVVSDDGIAILPEINYDILAAKVAAILSSN